MSKQISKLTVLALLAGLTSLTGCATITEGVNQNLTVVTDPAPGATCRLSNSKGEWYVKGTPGSATVHRAYGDLNVNCQKDGYKDASINVKSKTKGMAFGNVIIGGAVGATTDVVSGAAYDYPQTIIVSMDKTKSLKKSS